MMRRLLLVSVLLTILGVAYLPGPNGLVSFIKRKVENRRLAMEIRELRLKNILLRAKKKRVSSPRYWKEIIEEKMPPQEKR